MYIRVYMYLIIMRFLKYVRRFQRERKKERKREKGKIILKANVLILWLSKYIVISVGSILCRRLVIKKVLA